MPRVEEAMLGGIGVIVGMMSWLGCRHRVIGYLVKYMKIIVHLIVSWIIVPCLGIHSLVLFQWL